MARGAAVGALEGPYLSRTRIRDSLMIRRALTGPVMPNRGSDRNPTGPLLQPTRPDGTQGALMDDKMDPYECTTKIRIPAGLQRDPI